MAAVAGYQTIGTDGPKKPLAEPLSGSVKDRLGAVARGAGDAAVGARDAVAEVFTAPMPAVNVYTEPLNPAAPLTIRDRVSLVLQSCREWREFFDWRALNFPPASEVKLRYGANFETFFYNYLVIAVINLVISAVFHISSGLQVALLLVLAAVLYVVHPDPITIGAVTFNNQAKHAIMATCAALVLIFGNVLPFLLSAAIFAAAVVIIHGFFREHREVEVAGV